MATSAGLARYSESKQTWAYFTRADGMPSDQAQAMAFDRQGNIYVGTQCDGIAIAHAADGYKQWQVITGPDKLPTQPSGSGLPTNLINDMLVAHDGTVYAATTTGLAWSHDQGNTWQYVRGEGWADKVRGSYGGPPAHWREKPGAWLAEDYVTCLAEGENGFLWIGYRQAGSQLIDMQKLRVVKDATPRSYVTCITASQSGAMAVGIYGDGCSLADSDNKPTVISAAPPQAEIPPGAAAPTMEELKQMASGISTTPSNRNTVAEYLGEDWTTQGDWVGRYGRQHNVLCGAMSPFDQQLVWDNIHQISRQIGPHHVADDCLRAWIHWAETDNPKTLYDPIEGTRRQSEWDDHGEAYPPEYEGPDIWISITVPAGVQRVSLYFMNKDGHTGSNRYRDYPIDLFDGTTDINASHPGTALAHTRLRDFWGGVYKQFLVQGSATYRIRISRNGSLDTILSGVFIDRIGGETTHFDNLPIAWLGNQHADVPQGAVLSSSPTAIAAVSLWKTADPAINDLGCARAPNACRRLCIRAISVDPTCTQISNNWHREAGLWTKLDRRQFCDTMNEGWTEQLRITPEINWSRRPSLQN